MREEEEVKKKDEKNRDAEKRGKGKIRVVI